MATVKANYTKSLDLVALAFKEYRKGNPLNASRLFVAAATHGSAPYAMRVIQATNASTQHGVMASRGKVKARRRLKAESEFEDTDQDTLDVLETLDDDVDIEGEAEDEEFVDDDIDADEDDIEDVIDASSRQARSFARSLRAMRLR